MAEILLIRHGQSYANKRDLVAFTNEKSPLTEKGIGQAKALGGILRDQFGIDPASYDRPVLSSKFTRTQQTAAYAGFRSVDATDLINESNVDREIGDGIDVIRKHRLERWVPQETRQRAAEVMDMMLHDGLNYEVYFTHGMFIASFLLEMEARGMPVSVTFDDESKHGRGYVPLQTAVVVAQI